MSAHFGFCWPCVVRVINTLGIELKLVTGTNSIHSIVIRLFNKYFLEPYHVPDTVLEVELQGKRVWGGGVDTSIYQPSPTVMDRIIRRAP